MNYYDVLGVQRDAEREEIQAAFRVLAKRYHPDRNRDRKQWAEGRIKVVLEAYKVLTDPALRVMHDRTLDNGGDPSRGSIWDSLRERRGDLAAQSRLILHDLLNGHAARALETFEVLSGQRPDFDLFQHLTLEDYLDCEFLLGEEYERQNRLPQALRFYEDAFNEERQEPRLRYFFDELKDRLRNIYCKQMATKVSPAEALAWYRKALTLGLTKRDEAFVHKKMAETYVKMASIEDARAHLERAFELCPKLQGCAKIRVALGVA